MALNANQQTAFNRQISKMKEDGFFLPAKRSLAGNTRYLIVSYGGTGAAALFGVKKQLETVLPKVELDERIRFLAIDTDKATQKSTKEVKNPDGTSEVIELDSLSNDQFIQLSGSQARLSLDSDENVAKWINPQLRDRLMHDNSQLDGTGAGGVRQTGRLTLYPANNVNAVTGKVRKLVGELTNDNAYELNVMVLSGIAGGTGSGTVIDLTYLIRHTLESMPGDVDTPLKNVPGRTKYFGFVLLPPTGDSTRPEAIQRGNRNGYAALKEINHFMNIDARLGRYTMTYGTGTTVTSEKNIFDVCYLLDGTADGVAFNNPRDKAIHVLANSILDMITASQTKEGKVQSVASFMNDKTSGMLETIANVPANIAMRDADYTYCALGHSEFAMPSHEIKAYVAKKMFDGIHRLFRKCENVEEEDVKTFLRNVLKNGAKTKSATVKSMDAETETWFTKVTGGKGGPYFVVNLLRDVAEEVRQQRNKMKLARINMASDEELDYIESYAVYLNNTTFDVYTAAMDALKDMMGEQFGVVVKAGNNYNTYNFIPQSMGAIQNVNYVIDYLEGLINQNTLYQLTNAMLREMIDKKNEWTALVSNEDPTVAPNAMRMFWNVQLDKIVNSTLEDFLIKYYAGDSDAYYSKDNHAQTYPYLQQAAQAIYNQMLGAGGSAQPMAGLSGNGLQPSHFNAHTYLMVPEKANNLYEELKNLAANRAGNLQVDVCTSMASDRISCYKQYTSIPAFKLNWVCDAEEDYERDLTSIAGIGSHISETAGGNQWKTFPNLLPRSTWRMLPKTNYDNPRERGIAERADSLFDRSQELKLTSVMANVAGAQNLDYSVDVLPVQYRPKDELFRDLDRCIEGSDELKEKLAAIDADAEQCANELFSMVKDWGAATEDKSVPKALTQAGVGFQKRALAFSVSILTYGPNAKKPEGWDEYMAKCMLRKLPDVMNEVNGTVMVMEKVVAKVNEFLRRKLLVTQFAHYLATGMFQYNADKKRWQYMDRDDIAKGLVTLKQKQEPLFQYYLMFNAFRKNAEVIAEDLKAQLKAVAPIVEDDEPCADFDKKEAAFEAAINALFEELKAWNQNCPIDDFIKGLEGLGYKTKAIKNFYRTLYGEVKNLKVMGFNQPLFFPVVVDEDEENFEEEEDADNDCDF